MPIPQIKNSGDQSWRDDSRRGFLRRATIAKKAGNSNSRTSRNEKEKKKRRWKILAMILGALVILGSLSVVGALFWLGRGLPDPNQLIKREVAQSTQIFDRTGQTVLYEIHGDEKRTMIKLEDIPKYVVDATVAIEDKNFYKHKGFSLWAILRTVITNVVFHKKAGGSTLTQQFIKNSVLTNEKTYTRKIKELMLAYRLERKFSKQEILQMYFNEIPYGSTAYGVEAASQMYFGKSARDLNLAEAAILAALPQAPSKYSPFGPNRKALIARQQYILDLMVEQGYISEDEAKVAKEAKIEFAKVATNITAPHFVMYIKEILAEKYGEKAIEQNGLKIITTLDLFKQKVAEEIITEFGDKNASIYKASNAALLTIDPKTGQIVAMVGSRDYYNEEIDGQVNIITSLRQPGSSIKPLVYATAFLKGYTPNTSLYDVTTNFSNNDKPYEPHNYDAGERGPVSMRKALAGSLNIPAVKTLYLAGINKVVALAKDLGYTSFADPERFGLSLVLGGGEVKMLEHVNAFSAFAREGTIHPVTGILRVEDASGKVLEEYKDSDGRVVFDPKVARMLNDVLSDNNARSYVFGTNNYFTLGARPVAAKSGTTNDFRDAWTIGYTPSLVTGVWVGNNDNSEMRKGSDGGVVAAPIWNAYMKRILGDTPIEQFRAPEIPKTGKPVLDGGMGLESKIKIDKISGLLATADTPSELVEEKTFVQPHCILYYVDKDNPTGDYPTDPAEDPQFTLWESGVQRWLEKNKLGTSTPPTESDNTHTTENKPEVKIIAPENNSTITKSLMNINIEAIAKRGAQSVELFIDNVSLGDKMSLPFVFDRDISFISDGYHNLKARVCDDVLNCAESSVEININLADRTNTPLDLTVVYPTAGAWFKATDFPARVVLSTHNGASIKKLDVYLEDRKTASTTVLSAVQAVRSNSIELRWTTAPIVGSYRIYAEAENWGGVKVVSEKVDVEVK